MQRTSEGCLRASMDQVTEGCVQSDSVHLCGWRLHSLISQSSVQCSRLNASFQQLKANNILLMNCGKKINLKCIFSFWPKKCKFFYRTSYFLIKKYFLNQVFPIVCLHFEHLYIQILAAIRKPPFLGLKPNFKSFWWKAASTIILL